MKNYLRLLFAISAFLAVFHFEQVQAAKLPKSVAFDSEEEQNKVAENLDDVSDERMDDAIDEKNDDPADTNLALSEESSEEINEGSNEDENIDKRSLKYIFNSDRRSDHTKIKAEDENKKSPLNSQNKKQFSGHDFIQNLLDEQ